ncbi:unnamed protein product [Moneuplotes crassus]|uniref:FAD-binding FR-type domain-containing protein n=1 Tax=Euplotes crassus TaxID=5936 RepID=A0AAD2CZW9_EUPCR|nr:unnamed protein product [Moneuplotes crassus]
MMENFDENVDEQYEKVSYIPDEDIEKYKLNENQDLNRTNELMKIKECFDEYENQHKDSADREQERLNKIKEDTQSPHRIKREERKSWNLGNEKIKGDIKRARISKEDPEGYIKKAFGPNFEFSEEYLTSNIKSETIIKAIKKRYGFKKVTKSTMKHILYEGARLNRVLRINDSCFDRMVDILNIKFEAEEEDKFFAQNRNSFSDNAGKGQQRKINSQKNVFMKNSMQEQGSPGKSKFNESYSTVESILFDNYTNDFENAVDILQSIINLENEHLDKFKPILNPSLQKGRSKVAPVDHDDEILLKHQQLMKNYEETIHKLLSIRFKFSQKLKKDALPSITTQPEEMYTKGVQYDNFRVEEFDQTKKCIDLRRNYVSKLCTIFTVSVVLGVMMGTIIYFTDYYELIGWWIICSKGSSVAILFILGICMFFISHDLMTCARRRCKNLISGWLDHYFMIHKFCGFLLTVYSIVHSFCHLAGSLRILSGKDNVDEINKKKGGRDFDEVPTYIELVTTTLPGITGVFLLLIICIMAITSTKWVRMNYFQLFGYTHMALFPLFCLLLLIHGCDFWFNFGVPYAIILVTPGFVTLIIQQIMRVMSNKINHFEIIDVSLSSDSTYMLVYLQKPKDYKLIHGQYVFVNCPVINALQWHPYTVASSPNNPYLILMVKGAGDWSLKLIRHLYECKQKMMKMDTIDFKEHSIYDIFNLLHDFHQELPLKLFGERNKLFYPKIKISKACSTPNDTFIDKKNIILVGAGSGISPYLCLLEEVIRDEKGKKSKYNFDSARLIFVAREGEQISWISNYLFHILNSACFSSKLEFNIFVTLDKNLKTLPCFLFWRAFLLISLSKHICGFKKKNTFSFKYDKDNMFIDKSEFKNSPVKVLFGRPKFESLFYSTIEKVKDKPVENVYVYSTSSAELNQVIFNTTCKLTKETGIKFHHVYEATS